MNRQALALLAASNTLIVVLMFANTAQAALNPDISSQVTNLNLVKISLNLPQNNPILHSLGCACPTCSGGTQSISF